VSQLVERPLRGWVPLEASQNATYGLGVLRSGTGVPGGTMQSSLMDLSYKELRWGPNLADASALQLPRKVKFDEDLVS